MDSELLPGRPAHLAAGPVLDALVVGGGIVGSGVARDAALRSMKAALVEQHDFASGTSGRSSRLLHGGLRYLAQGRLRMVREASIEKRTLGQIAPHLASPLAFVFPTYRGSPWKRWKLSVGVKVYDLLCGGRNFGKSESLGRNAVVGMIPGLNRDGLTGAVRYFDGFTNDARLVIDTLRSAARQGAAVANYAALEDATKVEGGWSCRVRDELTGQVATVRTRCVVNAAGPWADRLSHSRVQLRLTKGVHLVIDRQRLPIDDAVVMAKGSRILFAIPWGRRVVLGTTDTDYDGPIASPTCGPEDARYILDVANGTFPDANLDANDIVSTWAGLRPLATSGHGDQSGQPSDISRSHQIKMTEQGWFDVAGGKLTTYRLMAEQTVDRVRDHLGLPHQPSATATTPLLPPEDTQGSGPLPPEVSRNLVEHFCRHEWAVHLDDIMLRRAGWAHYRDDADATAETVAGWMAELLGWDPARLAEERQCYAKALGRP